MPRFTIRFPFVIWNVLALLLAACSESAVVEHESQLSKPTQPIVDHPQHQKQIIKIAAIDWCPQLCPRESIPGYVLELVEQVFANSQYQLVIDYYPWSRAIKNVRYGLSDALLSPAKLEAPDLVYPEQAVGKQTMCFFTNAQRNWRYTGTASLRNMQIGIARDTPIQELSSYLAAHPKQFQFQPYHKRFVLQNAIKLQKKRIDAFVFTRRTSEFELHKQGMLEHVKNAGCTGSTNIYMAFTPAKAKKMQINTIKAFFDQRMQTLRASGFVEQLEQSYEVSNLSLE